MGREGRDGERPLHLQFGREGRDRERPLRWMSIYNRFNKKLLPDSF